jgi:hypothetical protein
MKLSLEALKERAEATASNELLETISGGTANSCHNSNGSTWDQVTGFFGLMYHSIKYSTGNGW